MEHQTSNSICGTDDSSAPVDFGSIEFPEDLMELLGGDIDASTDGAAELGSVSLNTGGVPLPASYPTGDVSGSTSAGSGTFGQLGCNQNLLDDINGLPTNYHAGDLCGPTSTVAGLGIAQGGISPYPSAAGGIGGSTMAGSGILQHRSWPQLDNNGFPQPVPYPLAAGGIGSSTMPGSEILQHGFRPQLDSADLPPPVPSYPAAAGAMDGSPSLAAGPGMGIAYQHGFGQLDGSVALANAQPEFDAGPAQQHALPAQYEANGHVVEFDSLREITHLPRLASDEVMASWIRAVRELKKLKKLEISWKDYIDEIERMATSKPGRNNNQFALVLGLLSNSKFLVHSRRQELSTSLWKEKQNDAIAIRGRPRQLERRYGATKKTYEFQGPMPDKKKLFIDEYRLLDPHKDRPDDLVIDDEHVFRVIKAEDWSSESNKRVMNNTGYRVQTGKRLRPSNEPSDVWPDYTKIYNKADKLIYAVCHDCDKIFSAPTKNGTSNLKRHHQTHLQPSSSSQAKCQVSLHLQR